MKQGFLLFFLISFFCGNLFAVERDLTVPAPGKLKSLIGKNELSVITSLTIRGEINDKDVKVLEKLENLTVLDMRGVSGVFSYLPIFPHLEQLYLPSGCKEYIIKGEVIKINIIKEEVINRISDCVMENKSLRILSMPGGIASKVKGLPNLKKVEIYGSLYQEHGNQGKLYAEEIDTLVLWDKHSNSLSDYQYHHVGTVYNGFMPRYIVYGNTHEVCLNAYEPNRTDYKGINILPVLNDVENAQIKTPDELDLSDVRVIPTGYFENCTMKSIKFSDSLRFIGNDAFAKCSSITSLLFPGKNTLLELGGWCFDECRNLKEIHFCCPVKIENGFAYGNGMVLTFDMPSSISFNNTSTPDRPFDHFVFNAVPAKLEIGDWNCEFKDIVSYVEIPKGTKEAVLALCSRNDKREDYKKNCFEQGGKMRSYNIKMEKPGTILSYLPMGDLENIDSLTITGFLYETDINVIEKCVKLKHLDLGKTVVTYSPELLKRQRDNTEAIASLFGMLGAMADARYENCEIGTLDYAYTKAFSNLMQDVSNVKRSNENCIIPANSFSNMYFLQTVILPYRVSRIGSGAFSGCINLKEVKLPPFLESIGEGSFSNCVKLKSVQFPRTLNEMGEKCFYGCNAIETVDLSLCDFTPKTKSSYGNYVDWNDSFEYCANLRELKFPQGITRVWECNYEKSASQVKRSNKLRIYFPNSLKNIKDCFWGSSELHFCMTNAPEIEGFYVSDGCEVYCPKGSVTSFYNAIGWNVDKVKIIEE